MRILTLNKAAFSLLEILLASIIFIISVAGLFATLNGVRAPVINKESELAAAVFSKQVLEALYSQVNADTYNNPCGSNNANVSCADFSLSVGVHNVALPWPQNCGQGANPPCVLNWPSTALSNANLIGGQPYVAYTVSCGDETCVDPNVARRVDINIQWPKI